MNRLSMVLGALLLSTSALADEPGDEPVGRSAVRRATSTAAAPAVRESARSYYEDAYLGGAFDPDRMVVPVSYTPTGHRIERTYQVMPTSYTVEGALMTGIEGGWEITPVTHVRHVNDNYSVVTILLQPEPVLDRPIVPTADTQDFELEIDLDELEGRRGRVDFIVLDAEGNELYREKR